MIGEAFIENLDVLTEHVRYRAYMRGELLPNDGGPTFRGVELVASLGVDQRSAVIYEGRVHLHPHTLEVLRIALLDHRSPDDPEVHLDASLTLILRQIDARASAAVRGLDDMARNFALVAEHRHMLRWCEIGRDRHRYEYNSMGGLLKLVRWCPVCGQEATDESLARAGVKP